MRLAGVDGAGELEKVYREEVFGVNAFTTEAFGGNPAAVCLLESAADPAWVGLDEDQVTGSAHAVLGPLWAARLGRDKLTAVQAAARRGELAVAVRGDRVRVGGGHAITVSRGELVV